LDIRRNGDGASLEDVEAAAWYEWDKRGLEIRENEDGASLGNFESAA
jgi:hypothetical protein